MVQPRSRQVVRLDLNEAGTAIDGFEILVRDHPDFAYPTTGVLVGDELVFVATSYADVERRAGETEQHGDVLIHTVPVR
jgi:hypothetical protein